MILVLEYVQFFVHVFAKDGCALVLATLNCAMLFFVF